MENTDINLYNISSKIKLLRINNNMKQKDLAKLLEVDTSLVSKYETSAILPSLPVFKKLTEIFNISADELLGINDKEYIDFDQLIKTSIDTTGLIDEDINYIKSTITFLKNKYH